MTTRGIDISNHQGIVDFDLLKNDVSFCIPKATEGVGYFDPYFERNWSESERVGLRRGAYHFARPSYGNTADEEATFFVSHLGPLGSDAIIVLDYEDDWDGDVVGWCKRFLDLVAEATGLTPYIYLNLSLINSHDWSSVISAGYPLWLAYYDQDPLALPSVPWPKVAIKQWTSSGTVSGVAGRVDLNTSFEEAVMTEEQVRAIVRAVLQEEGYPNFVTAVNRRLAIDAHHGHHVVLKVNDQGIPLECSEPVENM